MNKLHLWDLKAKLYRKFRKRFVFGYILERENKSLTSLLNKIPAKIETVLDLGTGDGNALQLVTTAAQKIGVDSSLIMLFNARKNVNALFINSDLLHLSVKSRIADIVLAIGVFEYFSKLGPVLCEIYRITKDNAHIIISYSPNNVWTFLRQFSGHRIYPMKFDNIIKIIEQNDFQFIAFQKGMMQHQILIKKSNLTIQRVNHATNSF